MEIVLKKNVFGRIVLQNDLESFFFFFLCVSLRLWLPSSSNVVISNCEGAKKIHR